MEKSKFAIYADRILLGISIWLLLSIVSAYFIRPLYLTVLISSVLTAGLMKLYENLTTKRLPHKDELRIIDGTFARFSFWDNERTCAFLKVKTGGKPYAGGIILQDVLILPSLSGKLTTQRLATAAETAEKESLKLLILDPYDSDCVQMLGFFQVNAKILGKNRTYEFLKRLNALPNPAFRKKRKSVIKSRKKLLTPKLAKSFFITAIIVLLTGTISPYPIYCVIIGALNLALGIICLVR